MAEFPSEPMAAAEFLEGWLPGAFAEADVPEEIRAVELRLGVCLQGEGGGEWVFQFEDGKLRVAPGSREECAFSYVQSVDDWRGALWEGRGGAIGRQALGIFQPGSERMVSAAAPGQMGMAAPSPAALAEMGKLSGMIALRVTGAEGGDWSVAFQLGPGPLPEEPTTTVSITAQDAAALESGELDPMQAFLGGKLVVTGDMTLMMQMQAIQMQVALAQQRGGGS